MGLYLAVFDDQEELDGVEVGKYEDFYVFRHAVTEDLENGSSGSRFPVLILHSDCDGEWSPSEAAALEKELEAIGEAFKRLPPIPYNSEWKKDVSKLLGLQPRNLYECFFDVDGEPLIERLIGLARLSIERQLPILFQ